MIFSFNNVSGKDQVIFKIKSFLVPLNIHFHEFPLSLSDFPLPLAPYHAFIPDIVYMDKSTFMFSKKKIQEIL